MLNLTGFWIRIGTLVKALTATLGAAAGIVCAAPQAEPGPIEAHIIDSEQVTSIDLNSPESAPAQTTPLAQMHNNIVHNNLAQTKADESKLNALERTDEIEGHDQLNNLITRPIVVCDHPDQLSHVILNRRYFNSLPEQYLQEVEADLNRLAQHNTEFKSRLKEHDLRYVQHVAHNEVETILLQDYAQRRAQDKANIDELMSNYFADELTDNLHLDSLRPENQKRIKHDSNVQHITTKHGSEVAQDAAAAAAEAELSINTPLKLKLQEIADPRACLGSPQNNPEVAAQSLNLFKAAAAAPAPEAYIREQGITDMICAEGCNHYNPMHSTITPYFTYVTACCWRATVPPSEDNNEFYVLLANDCLNTQVEINILPHSQYTLPFLAQHVFTTLKEGERNNNYSNVKLTVHHHGYLITYEVLGVANAHFLTTSGDDIAMVVVTGDLVAGVDYVNTFKRADGNVLPQLSIPDIIRNAPSSTATTSKNDLPVAKEAPVDSSFHG